MSSRRLCVFAHINVGFHHFAPAVDVVAEFTRDMIFVLLDYMITTRGRVETSLSSRNRAFPNQLVTLVKVSALLGHMDHDLGRSGKIATAPVAFRGTRAREKIGQPLRTGSEFLPEVCAAAQDNGGANRRKDWDSLRGLHSAADASRIVRECNGSGIGEISGIGDANVAISMPLPSCQRDGFVAAWAIPYGFDAARRRNTLG